MKTITVDYYGFTGAGRTLKEGKAAAAKQLQSFVNEAANGPAVVMIDSVAAVISRTRESWQYQLIGRGFTPQCCHPGYRTKGQAERSARLHVAQIICEIPDNPRMDLIQNGDDRAEHMSWFLWQCRYRQAVEKGLGDEKAREFASRGEIT
jgi:hypothetical protein